MRLFTLMGLSLALAACDLAEEPFRPEAVVNATLVAGEVLPDVRLTQTVALGRVYNPEAAALSGAEVTIARLGESGVEASVHRYVEIEPGLYRVRGTDAVVVEPLTRYRLRAVVPDQLGLVPPGEVIRAETLVPDTFRVVVPPPDSVRYSVLRPPPQVRVSRSAFPGRQSIYVFTVQALEPEQGLTPAYATFLEDEDDLSQFTSGSSPLLNEASYVIRPDGTIDVDLLWLAVVFYGANRFVLNALDDALYDFLRSQAVQRGSATLAPGEIPEALTNVVNGRGVFGAVARQPVEVVFTR